MAVYNEVQVGRYVRFLQKFLSIKGRQPAPLTFSGELGAMWSLFHGVENRYLEGWQTFGVATNVAAGGAGFKTGSRLRNPVNSNVVAAIIKIYYGSVIGDSTGALRFGSTTANLASIQLGNIGLDLRGAPNAVCIVSTQNTTATLPALSPGAAIWGPTQGANSSADVVITDIQELPLLPGSAYQMEVGPLNQAGVTSWWWRERPLEESELK